MVHLVAICLLSHFPLVIYLVVVVGVSVRTHRCVPSSCCQWRATFLAYLVKFECCQHFHLSTPHPPHVRAILLTIYLNNFLFWFFITSITASQEREIKPLLRNANFYYGDESLLMLSRVVFIFLLE